MKSGIYKLEFKDGNCYVGKSNDIPRRLMEHRKKFATGTAASKLQACYGRCGYPKEAILIECHTDHIDLLETMCISIYKPALNTAPTSFIGSEDIDALNLCSDELLTVSTGEHLRRIIARGILIEELEAEVAELRVKRTTEELDRQLGRELVKAKEYLDYRGTVITDLTRDLTKLRKRNLWQRIFNT